MLKWKSLWLFVNQFAKPWPIEIDEHDDLPLKTGDFPWTYAEATNQTGL